MKEVWSELSTYLEGHDDGVFLTQLMIFILWHLCESRNALIFRGENQIFFEIHSATQSHLEDFLTAESYEINDHSLSNVNKPTQIRWMPPPTLIFKINFDATVRKE